VSAREKSGERSRCTVLGEHAVRDEYSGQTTARMMDMTWNACTAIAGLNILNAGYFEWQVTVNPKRTNSKPSIVDSYSSCYAGKDGHAIDEKTVREEFAGCICKVLSAVKPSMVPPLSLNAPSMSRVLELLRHPPDYLVQPFDLEEHPKASS
jgi:hypothetical protein